MFGVESVNIFLKKPHKNTCLAYAYRILKLSLKGMFGVESVYIFLKKPQKDTYLTEDLHRQVSQSISGKHIFDT